MRIRVVRILFCLVAVIAGGATASASQSARSAALGGAGHAGPLFTEALDLNPSYLSLMNSYALSAQYLLPATNPGSHGGASTYAAMASSYQLPVQFGAEYSRSDDGAVTRLAFAREILGQFSFGVGTLFYTPLNASMLPRPEFTLSATGIINSWMRAALVLDNSLGSLTSHGFQRVLTLGTRVSLDSIFALYLDPHWTLSGLETGQERMGYELGLEVPFFEYYFLRAGTFKNAKVPLSAAAGNGFGGGVGIFFPMISLDYSFSKTVQPLSYSYHNVSLTLQF